LRKKRGSVKGLSKKERWSIQRSSGRRWPLPGKDAEFVISMNISTVYDVDSYPEPPRAGFGRWRIVCEFQIQIQVILAAGYEFAITCDLERSTRMNDVPGSVYLSCSMHVMAFSGVSLRKHQLSIYGVDLQVSPRRQAGSHRYLITGVKMRQPLALIWSTYERGV